MIEDIKVFTNANLVVRGLIATMFDHHTRHRREILAQARHHYGVPVLDPPVRRSIRFAEAPGHRRCILEEAPWSPGAQAYRALARVLDSPDLPEAEVTVDETWDPPLPDNRLILAG